MVLLAGSFLLADPASAQQAPHSTPAGQDRGGYESRGVFRSVVEMVTLNVTVTDGDNRSIADLRAEDFAVFEDGVRQQVSFFAASSLPLDVAVLIDTSSSMGDKLTFVQQAAARFIRNLRPIDRASVIEFNSQVRTLQPLTGDLGAVDQAIRKTTPRGGTMLYTAVYVALHQLTGGARQQGPALRRPAIVVLTDGDDTSSLVPFEDLLDRVRRAGVAIYPISVIGAYDAKMIQETAGRRFLKRSDYSLKEIAQETGGKPFFPLTLGELDSVYGSVASELATQYALGYSPGAGHHDGSYRRVAVRIVSRPDARPRTRTGYFAPKTTRAAMEPLR